MTEISARVRSSVRKSILVLALLTLAMAAPSYAGGLPGQCVSCPQCPPCGGGGGGGGGGRGIPLLVCIFAPHLCKGWSDETPKPQAKRRPKYPEAFSRFDRLTEEVRDNLSDLVIPHDQDAITGVQGLHETLVRTDPEATAEVNNPSRGLVAGTGTAFFGPPGGGGDRFLPNPPELDLKVPTARSPGVADSARRLQYAIANLNKARNTKDLSADDQRFLIDQAAQMMSGQPVQLYLSDLKAPPVTSRDVDTARDVFEEKREYRDERVENSYEREAVAATASELQEARREAVKAAGGDPENKLAPMPKTREVERAMDDVAEATALFERFLEKDRELTREYRGKVADVLKESPQAGFHFGTAVTPDAASSSAAGGGRK